MSKYELLPEQLLYEGTLSKEDFFEPESISEERIIKVHNKRYWEKLRSLKLDYHEERKTGFPQSKELIEREVQITSGTLEAAEIALDYGCALNIAGGTHHAFSDKGEGFCLLNDQAIASKCLLDEHGLSKILIVDLDVHQGNGTAEIFRQDEQVFTFSMHGANNYPLSKEKSDWDIPLPDGTSDHTYLEILKNSLSQLIENVNPQFIFYQSGVDILDTDRLGRLNVTKEGCKNRDHLVLSKAKEYDIPITVSMGGGYSADLNTIVDAHANTFRIAADLYK